MRADNARSRPVAGAAPVQNPGEKFESNGTPHPRQAPDWRAEHRQQVRGTLVVVVETPGGKYRRRAFLTLASAQRAVARAEAAGHRASVVLARLEPVEGWPA